MANQFLNAQEYANTMLLLAKNALVTGKLVEGKFKDEVTDENGLKTSVKRPPRFNRNNASAFNAALSKQDIVTGSVALEVNQYAKVHIGVGDIEYVQSYNELMQNSTMKSAASTLAHQIDSFLQSKVAEFSSYVNLGVTTAAPGVSATDGDLDIGSPAQFFPAHTRLMDLGVPNSDLVATLRFNDGEKIRGSLVGGDIQGVNRSALEKARIPLLSEIDSYATQQGAAITNGTRVAGATTLVNGANQNVNYRTVKDTMVSTLNVDGQVAGVTYAVGERFTIAGVFAWDWRNQVALPWLQVFTIRGGTGVAVGSPLGTPITAGVGGATALIVSPAIIVQGTNDGVDTNANSAFGTVNAAPADNAVITHLGAAGQIRRTRAAWTRPAIQMVSARLHMPFSGEASYAVDPETGISIRYWRGSDITTGEHIHRWDCIYGATTVDPLMGTLIAGN